MGLPGGPPAYNQMRGFDHAFRPPMFGSGAVMVCPSLKNLEAVALLPICLISLSKDCALAAARALFALTSAETRRDNRPMIDLNSAALAARGQLRWFILSALFVVVGSLLGVGGALRDQRQFSQVWSAYFSKFQVSQQRSSFVHQEAGATSRTRSSRPGGACSCAPQARFEGPRLRRAPVRFAAADAGVNGIEERGA